MNKIQLKLNHVCLSFLLKLYVFIYCLDIENQLTEFKIKIHNLENKRQLQSILLVQNGWFLHYNLFILLPKLFEMHVSDKLDFIFVI